MRRLWFALVLLTPTGAQAAKYTLEQLLARVRNDYPGVVAARESVGSADAQLSQARRLWWPQGQVTFGFTLAPDVHCLDASGDASLPKSFREDNCVRTNIDPVRDVTSAAASHYSNPALKLDLQLVQPIYTSGKIEAAITAAHAGQDVARLQVDAAAADATLNAVRAYWGLKWARAAGATLDDGQGKIKEWVDKIATELDGGKASAFTDNDLKRLKIALDTVEIGLLDVRKAERIAQAGLRTLTGDESADIDDSELDVIEVVAHPLSYYEDAARTHRPEARMLEAARTAVHAQRNLRISEMLPDLGLVGTFNYSYAQNVDNPNNSFLNHPNSLGVGLYLALRQPLDFPLKLARLSQAQAEERAFEAKRREALGGIALDIERAFADAEVARKRNELTAHGEKIARGWFNSFDQLNQLGVAPTAKDMVDAARSYFELRLQHLSAIMDLNVALAQLKRAAGVE